MNTFIIWQHIRNAENTIADFNPMFRKRYLYMAYLRLWYWRIVGYWHNVE